MPNRIIKESICTSEDVAKLSMGAEILFYHLMVKADDFGVYFGNEQIIKNTCFPLKSSEIKVKQVESWLNELIKAGLIFAYVAEDGKKYIQFVKWAKHQQIRAKKSKYPTFDSTCNQLLADDDNSCRNPIQSNPNPIRIQSESEHAQASAQVNEQDAFAQFWNAYPNHKDKKRAESAFAKAIRKVDLETMLAAIDAQKRTDGWIKENGRFIPMPSTWLNGERWNDDAKPAQKAYWRTGRFAQTRPEQPYEKDDLEMAERLFAGKEQQ